MNRKRVLLLYGGESSEHDVSISSARNVYAAINEDIFDVTLCYIDRLGRWWLRDNFDAQVDESTDSELLPAMGRGNFYNKRDGGMVEIDVLLPILHGRNGEDGTIQGLAQLLHIPVVGCDMTASAIAMNKLACKQILAQNSIATIPYVAHRAYEPTPDFTKLTMQLGCPLFVKPARSGSSVGVSKVYNEQEFVEALEAAHEHDPIALIEQAISGRELEVAVLGSPPYHKVSGVGEIIPGDDFYSYVDKYASDSKARVTARADLDEAAKSRIHDVAHSTYEVLDCHGMARVDFLLDEDGSLYVLEVNTIPGFTNISMYPKLWREEGMSYAELVKALINAAL